MPVAPTFPGVYIEEVPSGVRTIAGVATSIAAFVDRFRRGPSTRLSRSSASPISSASSADWTRGATPATPSSSSILNGGTEAWVVRVRALAGAAGAAVPRRRRRSSPAAPRRLPTCAPDGASAAHRSATRAPGATCSAWRSISTPPSCPTRRSIPTACSCRASFQPHHRRGRRSATDARSSARPKPSQPHDAPGARNNAIEVVQRDVQARAARPQRRWRPSRPRSPRPSGPTPPARSAERSLRRRPFPLRRDLRPRRRSRRARRRRGRGHPDGHDRLWRWAGADGPSATLRPFVENAIRAADPNNPLFSGATLQLMGGRYRIQLGRAGAGFNSGGHRLGGRTGPPRRSCGSAVAARRRGGRPAGRARGRRRQRRADDAEIAGVRANKTGIYALEDVDLFNILCMPARGAISAGHRHARGLRRGRDLLRGAARLPDRRHPGADRRRSTPCRPG